MIQANEKTYNVGNANSISITDRVVIVDDKKLNDEDEPVAELIIKIDQPIQILDCG